ncbi:MAG: hypothetical protein KGL53_15585 [Elusimicrobia bacterium]|nr:hypothetical protein [Elusimicrobiota bacterium]
MTKALLAAAVAAFCTISMAANAAAATPSGIKVLSATYGGQTKQIYGKCNVVRPGNVTAKVAPACDGKLSCDYKVNAGVLGDPAPGCWKSFSVTYQCAGVAGAPKTVSVGGTSGEASGKTVALSCPKPGPDPEMEACRKTLDGLNAAVKKEAEDLAKAHSDIRPWQAERQRDVAFWAAANKKGLTVADCEQAVKNETAERQVLAKIAAGAKKVDGAVLACEKNISALNNELSQTYKDMASKKLISASDNLKLVDQHKRNIAFFEAAKKKGLNAQLCEESLKSFEAEKQAMAKVAAAPKKDDPALLACLKDLSALGSEVSKTHADMTAKKLIPVSEAMKLGEEHKRNLALWETVKLKGANAQECRQVLKNLETEKGELDKIAKEPQKKDDPALLACLKDLSKAGTEVSKMHAEMAAKKLIPVSETIKLAEEDKRNAAMWDKAKLHGANAQECRGIVKDYEAERAELQRIASSPKKKDDPALLACLKELPRVGGAVAKLHTELVAKKLIPVSEAMRIAEENKRNGAAWEHAKLGGVTAKECEAVVKNLQSEQVELEGLAKAPKKDDPAFLACLKDLSTTAADVTKTYKEMSSKKLIPVSDAMKLGAEHRQNLALWERAKLNGADAKQCEDAVTKLQAEKKELDDIAKAPKKDDTALVNCMKTLDKSDKELHALHNSMRAARTIWGADDKSFDEQYKRTAGLWNAARAKGATEKDCGDANGGFLREIGDLRRLEAKNKPFADCKKNLDSWYAGVSKQHADMLKKKALPALDDQRFSGQIKSVWGRWTSEDKKGPTMEDCQNAIKSFQSIDGGMKRIAKAHGWT